MTRLTVCRACLVLRSLKLLKSNVSLFLSKKLFEQLKLDDQATVMVFEELADFIQGLGSCIIHRNRSFKILAEVQ